MLESFKLEDLIQASLKANSKAEFAKLLKITLNNGKSYKKINDLISKYNIDISHFDINFSKKSKAKYQDVIKKCPICGNSFATKIGIKKEKVTCGHSCSNVYFSKSKHTELSNLKRSLKLKSDNKKEKICFDKKCNFCLNDFKAKRKNTKYCSPSCATRNRVYNGTHNGWSSRTKLKPSFPEKVVIDILNELSLDFLVRELKVGRWFIDFADVNRKIAIEIDGKQHLMPERQKSDEEKDFFLKKEGWHVHRIKWKRLTTSFRKEIKDLITEILK